MLQKNMENKAKAYRSHSNKEAAKFPPAEIFKERLDWHGLKSIPS